MESKAKWNDPVAHLRQALAEDAFSLYYQPIAALSGPVPYPMAEVFVRLREEEKALRTPGEFLPVLEHYGLMPELDRWVVRHVLRQLASASQLPRFCLNLSAQTLADSSFPAFFADELLATGVDAEHVLFEIEEKDALALPECTGRFAATVGSLGASLVIDGFGEAFDYLQPLHAPCVEFAKLHGSITRRLLSAEPPHDNVMALLEAACEVNIGLIAESVDERSALFRLKKLKLGYAQGFAVCKPQPLDGFVETRRLLAA